MGTHRDQCGCPSCHAWRGMLQDARAAHLMRWGGIVREIMDRVGPERSLESVLSDIAGELGRRKFFAPMPEDERERWEELYRRCQ